MGICKISGLGPRVSKVADPVFYGYRRVASFKLYINIYICVYIYMLTHLCIACKIHENTDLRESSLVVALRGSGMFTQRYIGSG